MDHSACVPRRRPVSAATQCVRSQPCFTMTRKAPFPFGFASATLRSRFPFDAGGREAIRSRKGGVPLVPQPSRDPSERLVHRVPYCGSSVLSAAASISRTNPSGAPLARLRVELRPSTSPANGRRGSSSNTRLVAAGAAPTRPRSDLPTLLPAEQQPAHAAFNGVERSFREGGITERGDDVSLPSGERGFRLYAEPWKRSARTRRSRGGVAGGAIQGPKHRQLAARHPRGRGKLGSASTRGTKRRATAPAPRPEPPRASTIRNSPARPRRSQTVDVRPRPDPAPSAASGRTFLERHDIGSDQRQPPHFDR